MIAQGTHMTLEFVGVFKRLINTKANEVLIIGFFFGLNKKKTQRQ
jgi:hypothetical protein